jgi:hypothetical protein
MISALERMRMEEVVDWSESSRLLPTKIMQDGPSQDPAKYDAGRCPLTDVSIGNTRNRERCFVMQMAINIKRRSQMEITI